MKHQKRPAPSSPSTFIYGRHAVAEALRERPDIVVRAHLAHDLDDATLRAAVRDARVPTEILNEKRPPGGVAPTATHQGVVAELRTERLMVSYRDFIADLAPTPDTALLILAEVQDPHNVGAVIRSAAAFGLAGVLIPPHKQAPVTGTVVKVSAGMAFRIPLVAIGNVNTTVRDLKDRGFWVYGLAGEGASALSETTFDRPSAFILGNEATGLREKTREVCDELVSIPMHPRCESLNAAASTAVVLAGWSAQHPGALS